MRIAAALALLALTAALGGCHGSRIREESYPPYYRNYESAPSGLRQRLDERRAHFLEQDGAREALLPYARASGELARQQISRWLAAAEQEKQPSPRLVLARRRALECADHALSLYRQYALGGNELDWKSKIEMSWLLAASGDDESAAGLLEQVEERELPAGERARLLETIHELGRTR